MDSAGWEDDCGWIDGRWVMVGGGIVDGGY